MSCSGVLFVLCVAAVFSIASLLIVWSFLLLVWVGVLFFLFVR